MKEIRRAISFLLALVMIVSMVPPMVVSAEETEPTPSLMEDTEETTAPTEPVTEPVEEITASMPMSMESAHDIVSFDAMRSSSVGGTCGDNLTWTLDDGELTISGIGAITASPWAEYASQITSIIIEDGVTSIGNWAFQYYHSLSRITIPDSVVSIGAGAFHSCTSLTNISIPDKVIGIENQLFYNCTSLTSVSIPKNLYFIGSHAFYGCSSLSSIIIPDTVRSIGAYAFYNCSNLDSINIPEAVTSIGLKVFYECSSLTNIIIPNGVAVIEEETFYGCSNLVNVIIPSSVDSIGARAFYECSALTGITIPDGTTVIEEETFYKCSSLDNVNIPKSVNSIGARAFYECSTLTGITIPDGTTVIEEETFYKCSSLANVNIPKSVNSIGARAFYECSDLTGISIPDGVSAIEEETFCGCSALTAITIPAGITAIRNGTFRDCSALNQINLPEGITSIGDSAFSDCSNLSKINVPMSVTSIGASAFTGCSSLNDISIPDGVTSFGAGGFDGPHVYSAGIFAYCSSLVNVTLPNSIERMYAFAFSNCTSLRSIKLPKDISSIPVSAFRDCSSLTEIIIPEKVSEINSCAFSDCTSLKKITIPVSVAFIRDQAFYKCPLTDVYYTGTEQEWKALLESIDKQNNDPIFNATIHFNAVIEDEQESITGTCGQNLTWRLENGTLTISGTGAMEGYPWREYAAQITALVISEGVTSISHAAFANLNGVTEVMIPASVTTIGTQAFQGLQGLTYAEIQGPAQLESCAFDSCSQLKTVILSKEIPSVANRAFGYCSSLTDVYFTGTEAEWADFLATKVQTGNDALKNASNIICNYGTSEQIVDTKDPNPATVTIDQPVEILVSGIPVDADRVVLYLDGVEIGTVNAVGVTEKSFYYIFDTFGQHTLTANAFTGEASVKLSWEKPVTVTGIRLTADRESAWTGETVNFTVEVYPNATAVDFYAEDLLFASVALTENTGVLAHAFTMAGDRKISARTGDGLVSRTLTLPIQCVGQLVQPVLEAESIQYMPDGLVCSWNATDNTDAYVLRVRTADGREVLRRDIADDGSERMTCTVSAEEIGGAGTYELYLMNSGYQYDQNESATITVEFVESDVLIAEGTCGPTATWTLTETGTLTISGTGMVTEAPWYDNYHAQITNVTVADGITSICEYAFADCSNLTKITVPASVDQISIGAFLNCTGITSAGPIGSGADYEFGWTSSIPSGAFCYLSGLSKITWPDSLTSIGDSAFLLCGFTKVVIPKGVKTIGDKAFADCASLKRLAIPSTADSVGEYAFLNCAQLEDVFIMSKSITIGKGAFMEASAVNNVFCAVSERNVEKIVLMEGNDPLINAEKYFDWNDSMETRVLIRRHGIWHDAVEEQLTLSVESNEYIDIRIILGMDNSYDGAVTFELTQNNQQLLSNQSGRFEEFSYPDYLSKDSLVSVFVYDFSDNVIYQEEMNLRIVDSYSVTFVHYDGETETDSFSSGEKITAPPEYDRPGFIFKGWYTSPSFEGMEFFDEMNFWSREKIEQDITLYQKWESSDLDLSKDVWPFGNLEEWFVESDDGHYEITDADFNELVNSLDGDSTDISNINKKRYREWEGSCFGLSSAVVLSKAGKLNIQNFPEGDTTYYTLKTAFTTKNTDPTQPGNIESLINFLHLRQYIGDIHDLIFGYKDEEETTNARNMIDKMKASDGLFVLTITIEKMFESDADHSVVAYDFTEISSGQYSFSVWDCNDPGGVYTIEISDSGVISCAEWEDFYRTGLEKDNEIFIDLYFGSLLSCEDLMVRRILEKPETLMSDTYAILRGTDIENTANTYCIETNYDDFAISNGIDTAVISDGEKISGNLDIYCNGFVGIPGAYQFEVPVLETGTSYTISQTSDGALNTSIHYDDSVYGFLICQDAENAGIVQFNGEGRISTEYENEVLQTVSVTYNNMTAPWYTVDIKGCSKGIAAALKDGIVEVESKTEMVADFTVGTVFNEIVIPGIVLNDVVTKVEEGENRTCSITRNSEIVTTNTYGFSVIFDSQMGTAITSLPNVSSGTKVDEPTPPTRPGYLFEGWFKDTEYTEPWDFSTDTVTEDLVLYAGWSVDPNYMKSVTFRMSGMEDQIVYMPVNSLIPADYAPAAAEGENILWFADRACTELWNFETDTLTSNLILYGQVENRVTVAAADLEAQTSVWIDGAEYPVQTNGNYAYIDLPDETATSMAVYTYDVGDSTDIHTRYPVSMKVWTLKNENGFYTATRVEELDNILQYSGSSIRVTGKQGIRMITSIDKSKKDSLTSDGLAGYTLKEYGTVVAWASQLENDNPLVLGQSYVMSNYAYKKGIADPVFAYDGNLMQYTNVLVGFSNAQCKNDLSMRPYMILKDVAGREITIYGGIVIRSIGYIALQNKDTFAKGTDAYNYVWDIIRSVYGDVYDEVNAA